MSLPPDPEARDEVDERYRRASELDPSRPGEVVRRRVLEHAAQLAARRAREPAPAVRGTTVRRSWGWWRPAAVFGTLAAAAIAGLMIAPRFLMAPAVPSSHVVARSVEPEVRADRLAEDVAPRPLPPPASSPSLAPPAAARSQARESSPAAPVVSSPAGPAITAPVAADSAQKAVVAGARRALAGPAAANVTDSGAALRRAAETGDLGALDRLVAIQPDINAPDAEGRTPLMLAILHGQTSAVSALLAYGADANAPDRQGTTPLQAARAGGRPAIIAALQRYGAR